MRKNQAEAISERAAAAHWRKFRALGVVQLAAAILTAPFWLLLMFCTYVSIFYVPFNSWSRDYLAPPKLNYVISYGGLLLLIIGLAPLITALTVYRWRQFSLVFSSALSYILVGIIAIIFTIIGDMLTMGCSNDAGLLKLWSLFSLIAALLFTIAGITRLLLGRREKSVKGAGWLSSSSIMTIILGLTVLEQQLLVFENGLAFPAILIPVDAIFQAIGWLCFAYGAKNMPAAKMRADETAD